MPRLVAIQGRHRLRLQRTNADRERRDVMGVERHLERQHLVKTHTETPNVGLEIVRLVFTNLRRQIMWRADARLRAAHGRPEHFGNAKITQLHHPGGSQKHILALQVAMHDPSSVHEMQSESELAEYSDRVTLWEMLARPPSALDGGCQITPIRVFHDDAQRGILKESLVVADDIRMLQRPQDLDLLQRLLMAFRVHAGQVHLLDHPQLALVLRAAWPVPRRFARRHWRGPHKKHRAEGAAAEQAHRLVVTLRPCRELQLVWHRMSHQAVRTDACSRHGNRRGLCHRT
mmetsp:Transcript_108361/g.305554  ORF Transcript_108361/g.305554 Transcript_108361/m.305554 type:complete len:288 (+) Transcript_108361:732-1595(+)